MRSIDCRDYRPNPFRPEDQDSESGMANIWLDFGVGHRQMCGSVHQFPRDVGFSVNHSHSLSVVWIEAALIAALQEGNVYANSLQVDFAGSRRSNRMGSPGWDTWGGTNAAGQGAGACCGCDSSGTCAFREGRRRPPEGSHRASAAEPETHHGGGPRSVAALQPGICPEEQSAIGGLFDRASRGGAQS